MFFCVRVGSFFCVILLDMDKKMVMKREIPWNLIVSKLKQESTAGEDAELENWLSDSGNKEVFEELRNLWDKIQRNAADYVPDKDYYWKELSRRMRLSAPASIEKPRRRLNWWSYAAAACAVVAVLVSFYVGQWSGTPEQAPLQYSTTGGKGMASLPDRSSVWLHGDTRLLCDMAHQKDERTIILQGEAFFDVTHNEQKPFVVQTEGMRVVVHGTKFNVESFPDMENTYVSLIEGSVSLETANEHRYLAPGEVATYNRKNHRLSIAKGDVSFASLWTKDEIVFEQRSLSDICRVLEKWYHVEIDLSPAVSDKYYYTFTLRNEPLEEILRLMSRIHPIKYAFNENNELSIYSDNLKNK